MDYLFDIDNMKCSYKKGTIPSDVVLEISHLQIPKGNVVFFVGPSGIGKSTILETLGFMNNTIISVDKFNYMGNDVRDIWNRKDRELSKFRNKEFSFIFQQCNLMHNFTAYENVMSTALIQGMASDDARKATNAVLKLMNLPSAEDRPIYQYSGGQQQRLAFARAILPKFKVLFGDEPTGNLDAKSAENLMNVLINAIKERQASAIIVSHDMHLAVNYADMIVQIQRVARGSEQVGVEHYYGLINEESIYVKDNSDWTYSDQKYGNKNLIEKLMDEI